MHHTRARIASSAAPSRASKTALGTEDIPEIAITSTTAPGVTHRFTNMTAFADEVANARIWSGFHYRFSTRAGRGMGLKIGEYVAAPSHAALYLVPARAAQHVSSRSIAASSRSVFARLRSRDTATLAEWMTCASIPRAISQRASQKPSRPAS
jgi:hypothetical protein